MSQALPKRAILIVNAHSRQGREGFEEARDKLTAAGLELIEAQAISDTGALAGAVRSAIARAPMVIVGGGDGTISSSVDHFVGRDTVFAVLPLGTANSFARTLGLPLDLDGAVEVILRGRRRRIDLGVINGDYYANVAAMGLSPLIADTVPALLKRWLGVVGYLLWAIRVAFLFQPFRLKVELDDGTCAHCWATEARIANGTHHGGVELVENQRLDSGVMVVQAVSGKSRLHLAWSWFATLFKLRRRRQALNEWRGRRLKIDARPRQKISIDGEVAAMTPVVVEVARGAIEVAAPLASQP